VLYRSAVRHVSIIGRRGTTGIDDSPNTSMIPLAHDVITPASGTKLSRQQSRILQILQQAGPTATPPHTSNPPTSTKSWSLDFFRSPTGLTRRANGGIFPLRTDLVVTALGHHSDPLLAYYDPTLGHLRTNRGRVLDTTSRALRRVYASGWAATGARGVLAATMIDAYAVADAILSDHFGDGPGGGAEVVPVQGEAYSDDVLVSEDVDLESVPRTVEQGIKEKRVVEYDEWKKIDAEEVRRGVQMVKNVKEWGGRKCTNF
ncbi:hypothetical protein BJV77DRAFT_997887, partial [Russula vinacea]